MIVIKANLPKVSNTLKKNKNLFSGGKVRISDIFFEKSILIATLLSAVMIFFVFIFIINKSWHIFEVNGIGFITRDVINFGTEDAPVLRDINKQFFHSFRAPAGEEIWIFGVLSLIMGTVYTTIGALIITLPIGLGTAVVISELAPFWIKRSLQLFVRFLASIPSIIFGLIGLMVVVPFILENIVTSEMQNNYIEHFQITGKSILAGIIVLAMMILPIITALSVDALNAVPKKYKEASLSLGLSHWRTIVKVLIPSAKSGILAGIILATGTAVGEAIALSMVTGGVSRTPNLSHGFISLLSPITTLASSIINKSETMSAEATSATLFACGVILLVTCTILSISSKLVYYIVNRRLGLD